MSISEFSTCPYLYRLPQQLQEKSEAQMTDWEQERSQWPRQWRDQITNTFTITLGYFWNQALQTGLLPWDYIFKVFILICK